MKLSIISEERIKDAGKCKSCKYNITGEDCFHPLFEELLSSLKEAEEIEYGDEIGFNKICPIWEPRSLSICENHGLFFDADDCQECESEFLEVEKADDYNSSDIYENNEAIIDIKK